MAIAIQIREKTFADIRGVVGRIHRTVSPASADRWHAGIITKIRTLANQPDRWPLVDEAADLGFELRMLLYGRRRHVYRILFTIDGQTVTVHRVRHAAQDWLTVDDF